MKKITNEEWRKILQEVPTNDDLCYVIRFTDKKEEAGEQLLKQNPTNYELRYVIKYTDKKEEAQKILEKRGGNERMIEIIKNR